MSYDQWKTASPYDDEPDVIEECQRLAKECRKYVEVHKELSDLTSKEESLLLQVAETFDMAADYMLENI